MSRKLISFDYAMKYILRQKANFDILEGFLTALLEEDITIIEVLESESNKNNTISKSNRVDLLIKDSKDRRMIIEIQHDSEADYLERMLWETSRTIVDNLDSGSPYKDIVKVISISILYFTVAKGNACVYKGTTNFMDIKDDDNTLTLDNDKFPEYYLIHTKKFNDIIETDLDEWIYLFKNSEVKEGSVAKHLDKAKEKLDILKMSDAERRSYEDYNRDKKVAISVVSTAHQQGIERGIEQGKLDVAKSLLKNNVPIDIIVASTGLSKEVIENL